ncbi:MAG: Ig-like domain-containing protein [Planctomycetaceae bacterium]|nr:Ig-like domain-containing protein [Planctomycetaceae bacterium]
MSTLGRPNRRHRKLRRRRRSFLNRQHQRPLLGAERLEPRALLAGDLPSLTVSEYWNYVRPTDINNDGATTTLDLLPLINSLSQTGPRQLGGPPAGAAGEAGAAGAAGAAGEAEGSVGERFYIDPNNDSALNVLDLLMVVNDLSAEGEDPPIIVNFSLVPVALGTNDPITSIQEGGHYELRVLVQDTGVLSFMGDTRVPLQPNGNAALGLFTPFLEMFWDRAQTDVQVNETQLIEFTGSPTSSTRLRLTFTDTDNTTQQTAEIAFTADAVTMSTRIRDALVALTKIGSSTVGNLRNIEVEPGANNRRFFVRFINDESNKDFANLGATLTVPGGATGVNVTETVKGDPNLLASFQEMFQPRKVRDPLDPFTIINDDQNDLLYYTSFLNPDNRPIVIPQANGVVNAGGINAEVFADPFGPRPGTQIVEVFRLRMTAKDKLSASPVTFTGAYPSVQSQRFITVLGDADDDGGPWTSPMPASVVAFQSGSINIVEPVSAINDAASLNEGAGANVTVNVLANDLDSTGPSNLVIANFTQPASGTVVQVGNQLQYTVPNGDFNGVVTFQYTIRDGVNASLTDTATVTITVTATNDAPVNAVPGPQTVAEDAPAGLVFGGGNAISISDVDAGAASVNLRLQSTNGTLKLPSLPGTLAITGDGTNDLIIVGSIANINPALSGLKYAPNLNFNGSAQITVTTNDNGNSGVAPNNQPLSDVDVININVTPTNDAPVNAVPAAVQVDESAQLSFTNGNTISVSDVDVPTTNPNMTVTLSTNSTQGGTLNVTAAGGANVSGNNSQNVTVSGTIAAVNATLASLKFNAGLPETVTLTVLSNDNGNTGAPGPLTDSDTVSIDVVATVRPRANPNTYNLNEGPASFALNSPSVLANDLANAGAQVTLESVTQPAVGTVTINDAGTPGTKTDDFIVYTPASVNFFGQVTFTYTISETPVTVNTVLGANATATVTLNIANVADAPVAVDDGPYAATEDTILSVSVAQGVLLNDTDADNLSAPFNAGLTAQLTQQPAAGQGTVNLAADGSFTWTPPAGLNFFGSTSFRYRAVDPQGNQSNEATAVINVASVNDAPVAVNDGPGGIYVMNEDDPPLVIPAPGVLSNDTDVETPNLMTAVLVGSATNGVVTLNPDGSFTFDSNNNFNSNLGVASFQYQVNDNDPSDAKLSNIATVTIQVNPVNDAPVAGNPEFTVEEGAVLSRNAAQGLRTAVTDVDEPGGFTGSIALVTGPAQGSLILNADGSFVYTPPATVVTNFDVTFTYTATDNALATSNVGTVTIHVTPFNDPPVAVADSFTASEDTPLVVSAPGVLGNDSDEETPLAGLTAVLVTNVPAAAGSVALNADGSFTYSPAGNFFTLGTPISFTYQVSDGPAQSGGKLSNIATVTINVNEVNDNPVANPDTFDFVIQNFTNQLLPSALANDNAGVDVGAVPGDVLSITHVGGSTTQTTTAAGNVVRRVGNDLFYDAGSFLGQDSFQYTISDGRGGTATATYTVQVVAFVPKDISGTVFVDNGDGVFGAGDKPVANAQVQLTGTNVIGVPNFTPRVAFTDELGRYSFSGLFPGNYTVNEFTPKFLKDGVDPSSNVSPLVKTFANDQYTLAWTIQESIVTGPISGLNFVEKGIDPAQLDDASGLITEILASSGSSGMVLAVGPGNEVYWSYCLAGWSTRATLQLEFGAGGTIPSLLLTIGGVTKRIYQNPSQNTGTGSPASPPAGSTARFRILGSTSAGEFIIRLDGTLSDFGFASTAGSASAPPEAGEGEGAPQMSDRDFRDAADQVFAEKAWA